MESAQIEMIRFSGPGRSTVCRAKSSVFSKVLEPKIDLPDTHPLLAPVIVRFRRRQGYSYPWRAVYRIYLVNRHGDAKFTVS